MSRSAQGSPSTGCPTAREIVGWAGITGFGSVCGLFIAPGFGLLGIALALDLAAVAVVAFVVERIQIGATARKRWLIVTGLAVAALMIVIVALLVVPWADRQA